MFLLKCNLIERKTCNDASVINIHFQWNGIGFLYVCAGFDLKEETMAGEAKAASCSRFTPHHETWDLQRN